MPYAKAQMEAEIRLAISMLKEVIYSVISPLMITAWVTPEPVPFAARQSGKKMNLHVGDKWGELWDAAWFHFEGKVPAEGAGKKVVLLIDIGGEACVFDEKGCPVQGLTNKNSEFDRSLGEPGKRVVYFSEKALSGEKIDLWIDAGSNDLFGKFRDGGKIQAAFVAVCDDSRKRLYYDMKFLFELMQNISESSARHDSILFTLYEASNSLHQITKEEISAAEQIMAAELHKKSGDVSLHISALGHSHIDLAWLWPLRETVRKGARTFATALMMMEHYPDYIFGASQPQLYQWMKVYYPELYQKVQKRVSEGRWETLGAMWVEADMNLPGGESLVRQLLYGKRFFQKEFGQTVKIAWLPDSFGYTAALPQLLKKSGIDYFCTTKLSWNLYNQLPHHTFIWEGIDGSPVLTHMPPESTYNSSASPRAVVKSETSYLDKGVSDQCLMLFGIGDGGGGPGEEHLEMLNREKQTADLAPVQQQKAGQFFEELAHDKEKYQSWHGDLYLERHQGTYTTRAHNKRNNRKIEIALHELEFLAVLAEIFTKTPYPAEELETIWKEVLLYQFHDILPGSAIARVYLETDSRYEILFHWILQLKEQALKALLQVMDSTWCQNPALIINSTSWARQEWLKIGDNWYRVQIPGMGCRVIDLNLSSTPPSGMIADKFCLENDQLRVEWANDGSISRIYDKTNRFEVLAPGAYGNRLAVYQDNGDAWDIPIGYADQKPDYFQLTGISSQVDGPRASVKHSYRYGNSQLEQEIVIFEGSRRIDFITKVDWRERHKMLRVAFPLNIQNGAAVGEIQFGSLERPSHRNTTWDMAKYEIYAHKWLDLSNSGYGAALLNDCKYGYKVFKNILDLNLLRSPSYPDPQTDLGTHEFTYALFPHSGNHLNGRVNEQGYQLNYPLSVRKILQRVRGLAREISLLTIHPENIIIETVKKAEESPAFIIRLYESAGSFTRAKLVFHLPVESVQLVDLMEQPYDGVHLGPELKLEFMPFEIQTLKVKCVSIPME